jgi:hypothetical protein
MIRITKKNSRPIILLGLVMTLVLSSVTSAITTTNNNNIAEKKSLTFNQPLVPHPIYGTAIYEGAGNAEGATVQVVSSLGVLNTIVSSGAWQVDCGDPGPNWPTGTTFTIWINGTGVYTGWQGTASGTVSGFFNNMGQIVVYPPPPNYPPVFGTPSPINGSVNQPLSLTWSIPINDPEGDPFTWSIQCSNGQTSSGSDEPNGTKALSLSDLSYLISYTVWVNATDPDGSTFYTTQWFMFTTTGNHPPVLGSPTPANNSINNTLSLTWSISITDPESDLFSWTIQCSNGQTNSTNDDTDGIKTLTLSNLLYETTYKVWVNVTDTAGSGGFTKAWYLFTTQPLHQDSPPERPETPSGPQFAGIGKKLSYISSTTDPDNNLVYYMWDWGDGTLPVWMGPFESGEIISANHSWNTMGIFEIKVKAIDDPNQDGDLSDGLESPWSFTLPLIMPKNIVLNSFFEWLFEHFPHAFPMLRHLMGFQ